jgi:hypothetical protein
LRSAWDLLLLSVPCSPSSSTSQYHTSPSATMDLSYNVHFDTYNLWQLNFVVSSSSTRCLSSLPLLPWGQYPS